MIDRFFYKFFGLLDDFFDKFISDAPPKKKEKEMIKNFKDIVILLITSGVLILLCRKCQLQD
jgi:hypothetical protein